ncbi:MAG: hypothetical protein ACQER9_02170 [Nanobdellota archaeon]
MNKRYYDIDLATKIIATKACEYFIDRDKNRKNISEGIFIRINSYNNNANANDIYQFCILEITWLNEKIEIINKNDNDSENKRNCDFNTFSNIIQENIQHYLNKCKFIPIIKKTKNGEDEKVFSIEVSKKYFNITAKEWLEKLKKEFSK